MELSSTFWEHVINGSENKEFNMLRYPPPPYG